MSVDPASLAITAALSAAQMALNASRRIEGPRLEDLNVTVADYGTPLNYFYGTRRLNVPVIWAEQIREEETDDKSKGGKQTQYKYYGTWAVAIADHEISAVTRIWFDRHLVYDTTGAGPVSPFSLAGEGSIEDHIRIYLGTEDQEPDPRMLATVEADQGAGTCPAYRGVSYVVFEDIPLEKLGNRLPQVSIEAVSAPSPAFPQEVHEETELGLTSRTVSPDGQRMILWQDSDDYEIWDLPTRTLLRRGTIAIPDLIEDQAVKWSSNGLIYYTDGGELRTLDPDSGTTALVGSTVATHQNCFVFDRDNGFPIVVTGGLLQVGQRRPTVFDTALNKAYRPNWEGAGGWVSTCGRNAAGEIWAVIGTQFSDTSTAFVRVWPADEDHFNPVLAPVAHPAAGDAFVLRWIDAEGCWLLLLGSSWWKLTDAFALIDSGTVTGVPLLPIRSSDRSFWTLQSNIAFHEIDIATMTTLRAIDASDFPDNTINRGIYDRVNHAIVGSAVEDVSLKWFFLDRMGGEDVTLGTIVADIAERCGVDPDDIDVTALDQPVQGYSWTQGSGRSILEPLLDVYDSELRPHDFGIQGIKRGGSAAGLLDVAEYVRRGDQPRYRIEETQDTDLPRSLTLSFADPDADQQPNSVLCQRDQGAVGSQRQQSIDMTTLVLGVDEARQMAERYFRRLWNANETYAFSLSAQRLAIEPGDVWNLNLDGLVRTARVTKMRLGADDAIGVELTRDFPQLASLPPVVGAPQDGRRPSTLLVPVRSRGFLLDLPLIRDADDDVVPILLHGASPWPTGFWPGARTYQHDGSDYSILFAAAPSDSALAWGDTTDALADASAAVWDRGGSVTVRYYHGEPEPSTTEAAIDANPLLNMVAIGSELIQYATRTQESDGSWTLSRLKRGRRGTEWATGTHAAGELVVPAGGLARIRMGAGDVGQDLRFRTVTVGREPETGSLSSLAFGATSHRPYAPAQFRARKDPSTGDWDFSWIRRSRVAGDGVPIMSDPPIGESAEDYLLRIYDGDTVVRTISASSGSATWTAAQQTTDFGSDQASVTAGVLQVGDLADGYETLGSFSV